MESLVVARWTKSGHDRLYVKTAGGYQVGYLDRKSGKRVLEDPAWREAFNTAIAGFESTADLPVAPATPATSSRPEPAWTDLALNEPGQGVRAKAKELQEAAPIATFVDRVLGVHNQERAWRLGDNGEVAVARELRRLDSRWRALHSVPVGTGDSDIDHVVIGPGGVFTVNAKHHPDARVWIGGDTFIVNGTRQPYIRNSRHEASRASKLLSKKVGFPVSAKGLIAVMGARRGYSIREQPRDGAVIVVARIEIAKWLARQPAVLTEHQLDAIYEAARRSTTWAVGSNAGRQLG